MECQNELSHLLAPVIYINYSHFFVDVLFPHCFPLTYLNHK